MSKLISLPLDRVALTGNAGMVSSGWLRWFNQIRDAANAIYGAQSDIAGLSTTLSSESATTAQLGVSLQAIQTDQAVASDSITALQNDCVSLQQKQTENTLELGRHEARLNALDGAAGGRIKTVTGNYTIASTDFTVLADCTTAALTLTLPTSPASGEIHTVEKIDSSSNTLSVAGNVEGYTSVLISLGATSITLQYDDKGTMWRLGKLS